MKNYITYLLKKRIPILIVLTLAFTVLFLVVNRGSEIVRRIYIAEDQYADAPGYTIFTVYTVALCIASGLVPLGEFSFKMRKVNVEQAFSLPIKRKSLFLYTYLFSIIEVIVPFTIAYVISVLSILLGKHLFVTWTFLVYYFLAILGALSVLGFISLIYCKANNVIDGIIYAAGLSCIIAAFTIVVAEILNTTIYPIYTIFNGMDLMTTWLNAKAADEKMGLDQIPLRIVVAIIIEVIGLVSGPILILRSNTYKAEDVTKKTENWYGYPLIITVYGCLCSCILGSYSLVVVASVLTYFGYALYRRNFNLGKKYWILMSISIVFVVASGILAITLR